VTPGFGQPHRIGWAGILAPLRPTGAHCTHGGPRRHRSTAPGSAEPAGRDGRYGELRRRRLRGRGARRRRPHRPHRLTQPSLVGGGHRGSGAVVRSGAGRLRTGGDQVRAGRRRYAVRRVEPFLRNGDGWLPDGGAAGPHGDAARSGHRCPVGTGMAERLRPADAGSDLAGERRGRPDTSGCATRHARRHGRWPARLGRSARRPAVGSPPAARAPRARTHLGGGAAVHRAGRPGGAGAAVGGAARRPRVSPRGAARSSRRAQCVTRTTHRDPGRRNGPRACSPRRSARP
jgi:hypothetical protein